MAQQPKRHEVERFSSVVRRVSGNPNGPAPSRPRNNATTGQQSEPIEPKREVDKVDDESAKTAMQDLKRSHADWDRTRRDWKGNLCKARNNDNTRNNVILTTVDELILQLDAKDNVSD